MSRTLMIQGTMSSVGKSLLVAALCRIFRQDGLRVAPFKAQNMALNSFVTADNREVGRAQAVQAAAAGIDVTVEMNPILIKPEADSFSQIVVLGRPWTRLAARDYFQRRHELWQIVTTSLDALRKQYELVVIEGAGSPVELNLRRNDVVNMAIAEYADAPVLLVGDIDRGGIFAQLLGTLALLEARERARVRGLVVNKFRGDRRLFDDGVHILEERGAVAVLGVVPFMRDVRIADEDSVALDERPARPAAEPQIDIAVVRLPHISNFDDFDPLVAEPGVRVRFVERANEIGQPDLVILPGTKTTIVDLRWLQMHGITKRILDLARAHVPMVGICGGYQMLGHTIRDPDAVEAETLEIAGLGLLPTTTTYHAEKETTRVQGTIHANSGLFADARGIDVEGYEIHMSRTTSSTDSQPLLHISRGGGYRSNRFDGTVSTNGWISGTYLHGLFDNDHLRHIMLRNLAQRKAQHRDVQIVFERETAYDQLAEVVRAHLDIPALYDIIGGLRK